MEALTDGRHLEHDEHQGENNVGESNFLYYFARDVQEGHEGKKADACKGDVAGVCKFFVRREVTHFILIAVN